MIPQNPVFQPNLDCLLLTFISGHHNWETPTPRKPARVKPSDHLWHPDEEEA
jgi:hypothetical protein